MTDEYLDKVEKWSQGWGQIPKETARYLIDEVRRLKAASNSQIGYSNQSALMIVTDVKASHEPACNVIGFPGELLLRLSYRVRMTSHGAPGPGFDYTALEGRVVRVSFEEPKGE